MLVACAQALLFGRVKRVSRERASGRRSREGPRPLTRLASLAQIGELARRLNVGNVFLELNSKRLYRSWEKGKENRCLVFTSSMKSKIRKLHIVFVQWRQRNVQKKCNARAEFSAVLKLVLFCGSRCRRRPRRHCSRSLFGLWGWRKKMWVGRIQSTLSKSDSFGAGTNCPSKRDARLIRESNKGSKERQGPTLVVHFTEVSPSYRGVR